MVPFYLSRRFGGRGGMDLRNNTPLSAYLSVSAPLPIWTRSPASGGTRNMKAVRKARMTAGHTNMFT